MSPLSCVPKVTKPGPTWTVGTKGLGLGAGLGLAGLAEGWPDGAALGEGGAGLAVGPIWRVGVAAGGLLTSTTAPASTASARATIPRPTTRPIRAPPAP